MSDTPFELRRFAQQLLGAQQAQAMYPPEHPRVTGAIRDLYLQANDMLEQRSELRIALADSEIVFDNAPIPTSTDLIGSLAALFRRQGIGKMIMNDGVRRWEVGVFVRSLNATPNDLSEAGGIATLLSRQGVEHISAGTLCPGETADAGPSRRDALPGAWQVYSRGLRTLRHVRADMIGADEARAIAAATTLAGDLVRTIEQQPDVFLLLHALQEHDDYSFTHSLNVAMLSLTMARKMGIQGDELMQLALAALLHDIGKEMVPREVLNKPGKLTEEEWEIMQRHSADGAKMLLRSPSASDLAVVVAYEHQLAYEHDSPDHGQWPLHFVSDLVCIADVYDALRSNRPYRAALPADVAMRVMREEAPSKFDPDLFRGFVRMLGQYPPGTCLELDNEHLAVSDRANPDDPARPKVLVVRDPRGNHVEPPLELDLAEEAAVNVRRVIDGLEHDLDPLDYL